MDLSFTFNGGKLSLGKVSLEDIPRAVSLLRQSVQHPPLFESDGLQDLRILSTDEVYERFLAILPKIRMSPITETFDMNLKLLERIYLYRAELYRRTRSVSRFVRAYEAFIHRFKETGPETDRLDLDKRSHTLLKYNDMLSELSQDYPLVLEEYEDQKRTKELMLEILRGPQVITEINQVIRTILNRSSNNRSKFKFHLSASHYRLIMTGGIEDEPLEVSEDLLLSLLKMEKLINDPISS